VGEKVRHYSETLDKALRVLDLFNEDRQGLTLTEISRRIGVNKTSVYRYLNTFCELGYLRRETGSKLLKLGPRAVALAHSFLLVSDLVEMVKPLADEVHREYQLHVDVGFLHGQAIYLVYRRQAKETLAFRHFIAARGLHYLATGKAALAFLDQEERLAMVDRLTLEPKTGRTITSRKDLLADLERTRQRGYSLNDEEFIPGLIAIGAPIFNLHASRVIGGVSFDTSTSRFSMPEFERGYARILVELAKKMSALVPKS